MKYLILSLFFCITAVKCTPWRNCDGVAVMGKVKDVIVEDCGKVQSCPLKKGANISFTVDFMSNEVAPKATAVVHGIIAGIEVPFPLGNPDACKNCGLTCPLKKSKSYTYSTTMFIKSSYPKMRLVVKWELKDQNKKDLFCVEVPVQIVSAPTKHSNHGSQIL